MTRPSDHPWRGFMMYVAVLSALAALPVGYCAYQGRHMGFDREMWRADVDGKLGHRFRMRDSVLAAIPTGTHCTDVDALLGPNRRERTGGIPASYFPYTWLYKLDSPFLATVYLQVTFDDDRVVDVRIHEEDF